MSLWKFSVVPVFSKMLGNFEQHFIRVLLWAHKILSKVLQIRWVVLIPPKNYLFKSFPGFRLLGHTSMTNTQKHKTENQQKIF